MGARAEGLTELIDDLESASKRAVEEVRKVVSKGALNIKQDWRRRWTGHRFSPVIQYTINYDTKVSGTTVSAEIGPDKSVEVGGGKFRTPGHLATIYEYGTPRNAPQPGGGPALDAEEPRFAKAIEDVAAGLLEGARSAPEPPSD